MSTKSRRFATGVLTHRTGTEGPRHDPYGYDEWSVTRNGATTTLHLGLLDWVARNGDSLPTHETAECVAAFEAAAGISLRACERAIYRYLPCCATPRIEAFAGFPGETISKCESCGAFVDFDFNESAVI